MTALAAAAAAVGGDEDCVEEAPPDVRSLRCLWIEI